MPAYELTTTLSGSAEQPRAIDVFRRHQIPFIQTANGLCLKTDLSTGELNGLLGEADLGQAFSLRSLETEANLPKDVTAFLQQNA